MSAQDIERSARVRQTMAWFDYQWRAVGTPEQSADARDRFYMAKEARAMAWADVLADEGMEIVTITDYRGQVITQAAVPRGSDG